MMRCAICGDQRELRRLLGMAASMTLKCPGCSGGSWRSYLDHFAGEELTPSKHPLICPRTDAGINPIKP
jgi:hypothetical protein